MLDLAYHVIRQPLFSVRLASGERTQQSLPEVLASLSAGRLASFLALQPHQEHAWHAFLVQLAAIALHRAEEDSPPTEAARWTELLLALTEKEGEEPWCLLVKDLAKPAFFQPPIPEKKLSVLKNEVAFPDGLDILVTAKNHDVKSNRIAHPRPEHWIYALVTLQTMQGFSGRSNYGIARMNGGFSNRPCVCYSPGLSPGERFLRDVAVLLKDRGRLVAELNYQDEGGTALLWLLPWDGKSSLALTDCDPFFIEICRRVRLYEEEGRLSALMGNSDTTRIAASNYKGNTGDPWTPILSKEGTSLTVSSSGFSYPLTSDLLFSEGYSPGAAQRLEKQDGEQPWFLATALVRGQGKTEGFHQRLVPIPPKARGVLISENGRANLGSRAKKRIHAVDKLIKKVFKPALCALLQAGPEKLDFRDERPRPWLSRLDAEVDAAFFEKLWEDIEVDDVTAERRWEAFICQKAKDLLEDAMQSVPLPSARRYRAIAVAERVFSGARSKTFPQLQTFLEKEKAARPQGETTP